MEIQNRKQEISNEFKIEKLETRSAVSDGSQGEGRKYDLEERTYEFARDVRAFIRALPRTVCNIEDVKQLVRASGSVGANYIEANGALSKKEFRMRIRISRREAKESVFYLRLVDVRERDALEKQRQELIQEGGEFVKIFSAILRKSE